MACMDANVLLRAGSSEIFASMDVIVSLGSQREWPGEGSRDLKRRGWVKQGRACTRLSRLGVVSAKPLRPWTTLFHPGCRVTGWMTARGRASSRRGSRVASIPPPSSSTASDVKWFLVQSMCWMLRNSIALTSSRREFRIGCGIIHVKRINRTASGNKIRI